MELFTERGTNPRRGVVTERGVNDLGGGLGGILGGCLGGSRAGSGTDVY
jgi:hypothetical protein